MAPTGLLVLRGVVGFGALSCFFYSVTHLRLAEATVIQFATCWGAALLGERPNVWTVGGSLLVLAGTLVASRRPEV